MKVTTEAELDSLLSIPTKALVDLMGRIDGDVMILGVAGKIGVSMAMQAVRAIREAGVEKRVIGVARFSDPKEKSRLEQAGVETVVCDLSDRNQVNALPEVRNIIYLVGRKFGTGGSEELTWAMNVLPAAYVCERFCKSRIVVFSTGCVYPLVEVATGGCTEDTPPSPVGEYSQSCLARERIVQYCSRKYGTETLLFRLNYSVALRYGVLHDIALPIWEGRKVPNSVGFFNVIWQGDMTSDAFRCLELCTKEAPALNVTGPEIASVEETALEFGRLMGKPVEFEQGESGSLCYLSNATKRNGLFGKPEMPLSEMIELQAQWLMAGGTSIGKPTHFEVNTGKF